MARPGRHDQLSGDAGTAGDPDACPCCGETLRRDDGKAPACGTCGYPENSAAWVAYDGCS